MGKSTTMTTCLHDHIQQIQFCKIVVCMKNSEPDLSHTKHWLGGGEGQWTYEPSHQQIFCKPSSIASHQQTFVTGGRVTPENYWFFRTFLVIKQFRTFCPNKCLLFCHDVLGHRPYLLIHIKSHIHIHIHSHIHLHEPYCSPIFTRNIPCVFVCLFIGV